jgi:hypothetical protein
MWKIEHVTLLSFCFMLTDGFSVVGGGIRSTRMLFTGTKEIIRSQHTEVASIRKKAFSKTALKDKWDDLVDEDEMEDPLWRGPPIPRDMRYIEFNLMRQNKNFIAIRAAAGPELTNDVYVRDEDTDVFWFAGKVARISDVSIEKAVARQYPLIEEHAARLRPRELFSKNGLLQIWCAPGDSEMDVAYNRPSVQFVRMRRATEVEGADDVRNVEVGFQGEIYDGDEEGFRTQRTEDGMPLRPEIQPGGQEGTATDDELNQIIDTS